MYYKLSNYDSYLNKFGNESLYEIISSRVGKLLHFDVLDYKIFDGLVKIEGKPIKTIFCGYKDFNVNKYDKVKFETF